MRRARFLFLWLICASILLGSGCSSLQVTHYDPNTYQRLTDLKPEVVELYDTFTNPTVDQSAIASVRLKINQLYEYENGKGAKNADTVNQIAIIRRMFARQTAARLSRGKWTDAFKQDEETNISNAFDIAIQSEALKNK